MKQLLKKILNKFKFHNLKSVAIYDFNKSNPLGGDGERVDITYSSKIDFSVLDMYQKNHFKRYEFALDITNSNEVCGDFACGTGYGSAMIATKSKEVIGMDLNAEVIEKISLRYNQISNLRFINDNLLNLKYENYFDNIISFETIEHFHESDIIKLLSLFNKALKPKGKLIFSTPYMQERSENAEKLGFHLTFYINEEKIKRILEKCGFKISLIKFQNYDTHVIESSLEKKEFLICTAIKI